MTELLQELERKLAQLPEGEQEVWLSHFLKELAVKSHESNGHTLEEKTNEEKGEWIGGRRPTKEESYNAGEKLKEFRKDKILGDDLSIKDLINEGRRY